MKVARKEETAREKLQKPLKKYGKRSRKQLFYMSSRHFFALNSKSATESEASPASGPRRIRSPAENLSLTLVLIQNEARFGPKHG